MSQGILSAEAVPFLVILRDYGTFLSRSSGSIIDFIVESLRVRNQLDVRAEVVRWLVFSGSAYLIFDGLDELTEVASRKQIASAVESFARLHCQASVLVTSRRVGYQQAPLSREEFATASLGEFTPSDVTTYVTKWFELDKRLTPPQKKLAVEQFVSESATVEDLRKNPLMLALMCNIYRTESYIPRNRPDVYAKCARMLFDQWDRHRGLFEPFDFEAHIEPAIMHLANVMYSDTTLQSGASEDVLVRHAADYLNRWQYESSVDAAHAASKFVRFCRGRAWVLTDVGLSSNGEALYQFTHRTFLEYFKAAHLDRISVTLEDLLEMVMPDVLEGQNDVVNQLALHIKSKTRQGGPDVVVEKLLEVSEATGGLTRVERRNLISFAVRSLAFLVPSPLVTQRIAVAIFRSAMTDYVQYRESNEHRDSWPLEYVGQIAREVRLVFRRAILDEILRILSRSSGSGVDAEYACSVVVHRSLIGADDDSTLKDLYGEASAKANLLMHQNRSSWPWVNVVLFSRDELSMSDVLQSIGLRALVDGLDIPAFSGTYVGLGESVLSRVIWPVSSSVERRERDLQSIRVMARYLESEMPIPIERFGGNLVNMVGDSPVRNFAGEALLVGAVQVDRVEDWRACGTVLACMVELWSRKSNLTAQYEADGGAIPLGLLERFEPLIRARISGSESALLDLEELAGAFLMDWARGQHSFVVDDEAELD